MTQLLIKDQSKRLGAGGHATAVLQHKFLRGMDFAALRAGTQASRLHAADPENLSTEYEEPRTLCDTQAPRRWRLLFKRFNYVSPTLSERFERKEAHGPTRKEILKMRTNVRLRFLRLDLFKMLLLLKILLKIFKNLLRFLVRFYLRSF